MTTIFHTEAANPLVLDGQRIAAVGYGNQGRSWALNLRDSGHDVTVCVRADETRPRAEADGFTTAAVAAASDADVVCVLNTAFVQVMTEQGIPFEAIMCELVLSGEVERTYGRLREEGFAGQMEHHSPTSQYGQLSRRGEYDDHDVAATMRRLTEDITSGRFADEWDTERDSGHPRLAELKEQHCGPFIQELEADLRAKLGPESDASVS